MKILYRFAITTSLLAYSPAPTLAADPPFPPGRTGLLVRRDAEGNEHRIATAEEWAGRRREILANMQLVMGPLPDDSRKVPLDVRVIEETRMEKYVRRRLSFAVEEGDRVPAFLLLPTDAKGHRAGVLCLHQTTPIGKDEPAGLGGNPRLHYAVHLAERGYVALVPDYPNYGGEYRFDPYGHGYASATMKGIWNHMRAVDLLQSLREVDPERIGVIGHSLGGHNSLFVAAFDPRIKCIVSNCGFTAFRHYFHGNLTGWSGAKTYMPRIRTVYDLDPEKMPFDFADVLAALAPRALLAIAPLSDGNFDFEGVKECVARARPVYELLATSDRLAAVHPRCGHDFPPEARKIAYEWMDRWLKGPEQARAPAPVR
jgi:pimeloyl-ACP methyl ester carboxylesterase